MLYLGSDHGAFLLKKELIETLKSWNIEYEDCGTYDQNRVDYPDIAAKTCKKILDNPQSKGVLLCGTGLGMSIAANKIKGIRAALCSDEYSAKMSIEHNNANILCLGGRVIGPELAKSILKTFLNSSFAGERHQIRIDKISNLES